MDGLKGLFIKDVRTQGGRGVIDLRTRGEGGFLECGRPYFNFFRDGKLQIVLFRFRFSGPV